METRKLQQIAGRTYVLSLPKLWVEKNGYRPGEEIGMIEGEDGSLRLCPKLEAVQKSRDAILELDELKHDFKGIRYCLFTYYMQGSDKIRVTSSDVIPLELKKRLKHLVVEMPGAILIPEEKADELIFRIVIDTSEFLLESLIEEASLFSLRLQKDAIESLFSRNLQSAAEVVERSEEAVRYYRMMIRQVVLASLDKSIAEEIGVRDFQECVTFVLVARDIGGLIRHSRAIAQQVRVIGRRKVDREVYEFIGKMSQIVYEMQRDAIRAFLKKKVNLAVFTMSRIEEIRRMEKEVMKLIDTSGAKNDSRRTETSSGFRMACHHLRRIAGYAVAISDDAMNRALTPILVRDKKGNKRRRNQK